MNIGQLARQVGRVINDNSPVILTGIGVAGTLTTAILTGKACWKSAETILYCQGKRAENNSPEMTTRDKIALMWPEFIPPLAVAAVTVTSIVLANRIGTRRAAALAAAYSISEKALVEYREKVVEKLGESKERKLQDEIAQDRVNKNPVSNNEVIFTGDGDHLCWDNYSSRYFNSNMQKLQRAEIDLQYRILYHDSASLNEWYNEIGLPIVKFGDDQGWNNLHKLEVVFRAVIAEDKPCMVVDFRDDPLPGHYKNN